MATAPAPRCAWLAKPHSRAAALAAEGQAHALELDHAAGGVAPGRALALHVQHLGVQAGAAALLAGFLAGVNKVGKFPSAAAAGWPWPLLLNPAFDDWRGASLGPWLEVDPAAALSGDE